MKKLLLTLLLLFALGSSGAWAQAAAHTCLFGSSYNSGGISSYSNNWTATNNGETWNIQNFNNNNNGWDFVKCGSKNAASVGVISTAFAVPEVISEVVVTIDAITTNNVNSIKLYVADNANFTGAAEISGPTLAQGAYKIVVPGANQKANQYYKIAFDCKQSSNGVVSVSKVELFAAVQSDEPTITAATGTTIYSADDVNEVAKGTPVKFTITRYDEVEVSVTVNDEPLAATEIVDGVFSLTINEETTVEITAGTVEAIYMFSLKKAFTPDGWSWKRVTDVSTFREGDKLVIASAAAKMALGNATSTANTIPSIGVSFETDDDNDVYLHFDEIGKANEPLILELAASTVNVDNNIPWVLKSTNYAGTDGYLSATSDNKNELQIVADEDDLSIEISEGNALIDFNGHTHHILGYNTNLGVFACYAQDALDDETGDNQYRHADIQVYRLTNDAADLRVRYTATAADGTKYSPWTTTDVAKGTKVTFGVQFYSGTGAVTIKVGEGNAQPLAGNNVLTINEDTTVEITTDVKTVTYIFKVRSSFTLDNGKEVLYYTVAEALEAVAAGITPTINVKGIVKEVTNFNSTYGSITYTIADNAASTDVLTIYGGLGFDYETFTAESDIEAGAKVIVCGQIFNYQDKTPEMALNNYLLYYNDGKVSISATSGDTSYKAGYTIVNNGTKVNFNITNADEILATVNGEDVDFVDGKYTLTVNGKTEVSIVAGAASATYVFVQGIDALTPEGHTWVRVDEASTLRDGDKLIIASADNDVALSNQNSASIKYLYTMEATVNGHVLTWADGEHAPLVFSLQGNADNCLLLALNSTSIPTGAFISGSSSGSDLNIIAASESNMASSKTSITIDASGNAKVKWGERYIAFNSSTNPNRFASYASSSNQKDVQLYRLTGPETSVHSGVVVKHTHDQANGVVDVQFSFNVVNHTGEVEHHYVSLLDADGNEIEVETIEDLSDNNRMGAPRRAPGEVTNVSGHFALTGEALKTTVPTTIAIKSHIGNQNVLNTYYAVENGGIATGIQEVEAAEAEAEYYNLQGLRVSQPEAGQLYIKRQGSRVSKVRF